MCASDRVPVRRRRYLTLLRSLVLGLDGSGKTSIIHLLRTIGKPGGEASQRSVDGALGAHRRVHVLAAAKPVLCAAAPGTAVQRTEVDCCGMRFVAIDVPGRSRCEACASHAHPRAQPNVRWVRAAAFEISGLSKLTSLLARCL